MFNRKFPPAQEKLSESVLSILFCCVWYAMIFGDYVREGYQSGDLIFIVAGLPLIYTSVMGVRRAMFYRNQRRDAINLGRVRPGRIVSVKRTSEKQRVRRGYVTVYNYYFEVACERIDRSGAANPG